MPIALSFKVCCALHYVSRTFEYILYMCISLLACLYICVCVWLLPEYEQYMNSHIDELSDIDNLDAHVEVCL